MAKRKWMVGDRVGTGDNPNQPRSVWEITKLPKDGEGYGYGIYLDGPEKSSIGVEFAISWPWRRSNSFLIEDDFTRWVKEVRDGAKSQSSGR